MPVSAADAELVRDIVRKRAAIALDASKTYLIESRLCELVRKRGYASIEQLVALARSGEQSVHVEIVEALTTHETSFFRDSKPFEALRRSVLPELIAARSTTRALTVWSAACSSGQEPYSLAMLLLEQFPELATWRIRIVATDISEQVLAVARAGSYSQLDVNRGLPATLLVKYFERRGVHYRVRDSVRNLVEFRQANLLDVSTLALRPDIVLLRNVLIYFDLPARRTILDGIRSVIAHDGALFLGTAETPLNVAAGWSPTTKENSTYYKVQR